MYRKTESQLSAVTLHLQTLATKQTDGIEIKDDKYYLKSVIKHETYRL